LSTGSGLTSNRVNALHKVLRRRDKLLEKESRVSLSGYLLEIWVLGKSGIELARGKDKREEITAFQIRKDNEKHVLAQFVDKKLLPGLCFASLAV
jgi:hypothetical protein